MKKKLSFVIALTVILILVPNSQAVADSPYTTWAYGPNGELVLTQDAYSPYAEIDLPIKSAEDMFITPEGEIYIADTGNSRIVRVNKDFEIIASYGEDFLQSPSGVFVDKSGTIYVADSKKNAVIIMDNDGNLMKELGRPVEPLFGKSRDFLPRKIVVDARENLYVISEGSVDGVVQMNTNGNFIGYFAANTAEMSLRMVLQRTFLTEEQLAQFIRNEAASPSNLAIDNQGMLYTITAGTTPQKSIRKFNIAGINIFPEIIGSNNFRDIDVSDSGLVMAVDADGHIYEYDITGVLLFQFGAKDTSGNQRMGTLTNPTAIGRHQDYIYVLDKEKNAIVVYSTTAFAQTVHAGTRLYLEGFYEEAKPYFEEVLNYNGLFITSYKAIADAYFKEENYAKALEYYRYAEDRNGYSQAYWEMRNVVLQTYLSPALMGIIGLSILRGGVNKLNRRYKWFDPIGAWFRDLTRFKLVDDFIFMFRFIGKPADSFYYIKKDKRGSLIFALLIFVWIGVVRVLSLYWTGFVFNPYASTSDIRIENEILMVFGIIALWITANYLVSTISDGEGRVKDVIIGTAYSLFPYALFALPIALLSRVLTFNEAFVYSFSQTIMYAWIVMMLFIMVMEIHNYFFSDTLRNVLITIFAMALFVLTGYILSVLFGQLFDFISAIIQELGLRG